MRVIRRDEGTWIEAAGYNKKRLLGPDDLGQAGTLVQLVTIPARTSVGLHHHDHATEVFHIISGSGSMTIGAQNVELNPGDTVTTEPGELHDARNDNDDPFEYVVFKTNWDPSDSVWSQ